MANIFGRFFARKVVVQRVEHPPGTTERLQRLEIALDELRKLQMESDATLADVNDRCNRVQKKVDGWSGGRPRTGAVAGLPTHFPAGLPPGRPVG